MFSRHHCIISCQTLCLGLCFLKSPLHSHLYPPPSPWFTPVGLSPPVCSTLTSQFCPHLFPVTRSQQLLLSFTYFIMPWIRTCCEGGCGCISGRDGEPASESGRRPPGGDLRVLLATLHEWDPVQESKSLWSSQETSGEENLAMQKLPQTKRSHDGDSLPVNHLDSAWREHLFSLLASSSYSFPASFLLHYHDCPSAGDGQ